MLNLNIFLGAMDCDHENEMWKEFPFFVVLFFCGGKFNGKTEVMPKRIHFFSIIPIMMRKEEEEEEGK